MPLTRLNDSAFDAQLEGVYFGMWNGSTSVRCCVSHEALTDKAQGIDSATERKVRKQLAKGVGILKVAKSLGIGTGTVQRISKERAMSL